MIGHYSGENTIELGDDCKNAQHILSLLFNKLGFSETVDSLTNNAIEWINRIYKCENYSNNNEEHGEDSEFAIPQRYSKNNSGEESKGANDGGVPGENDNEDLSNENDGKKEENTVFSYFEPLNTKLNNV